MPYQLLNILKFTPACKPSFCTEPKVPYQLRPNAGASCQPPAWEPLLHRTEMVLLSLRSACYVSSSILGPQSHPNVTSPRSHMGLGNLCILPTATEAEALVLLPCQTWKQEVVFFVPVPGSLFSRQVAGFPACPWTRLLDPLSWAFVNKPLSQMSRVC